MLYNLNYGNPKRTNTKLDLSHKCCFFFKDLQNIITLKGSTAPKINANNTQGSLQ